MQGSSGQVIACADTRASTGSLVWKTSFILRTSRIHRNIVQCAALKVLFGMNKTDWDGMKQIGRGIESYYNVLSTSP